MLKNTSKKFYTNRGFKASRVMGRESVPFNKRTPNHAVFDLRGFNVMIPAGGNHSLD
jgi:hypothetical protein